MALLVASAALAAAACTPEPTEIEPATTELHALDGKLSEESPMTVLLVADDADTPDAAVLRDQAAESLRAGLLHVRAERFGSCGDPDPAAWHPGELRVVVVRPSAPDDATLLTPVEVPALAWITQSSTTAEVDAVVDAAKGALGQRLAQPGEVYRPIRAAQRALDLVTGARAPVGAAEAAFATTVREDAIALMLVASTRDDEDTTAVAALAPAQAALEATISISIVGPFGPSDAGCFIGIPGDTRLESWSKTLSYSSLVTWPCDDDDTWKGLISTGWADCGRTCEPWPISMAAGGVADCEVLIDQADLTGCDPAHGWRDPDGQATFVDRKGTKLRRCEVVQLSGEDLKSCRESLECSGCQSGFCVTEVEEILAWWSCEAGTYPWPLRFIGGAKAAKDGWIDVTCNTGPVD